MFGKIIDNNFSRLCNQLTNKYLLNPFQNTYYKFYVV